MKLFGLFFFFMFTISFQSIFAQTETLEINNELTPLNVIVPIGGVTLDSYYHLSEIKVIFKASNHSHQLWLKVVSSDNDFSVTEIQNMVKTNIINGLVVFEKDNFITIQPQKLSEPTEVMLSGFSDYDKKGYAIVPYISWKGFQTDTLVPNHKFELQLTTFKYKYKLSHDKDKKVINRYNVQAQTVLPSPPPRCIGPCLTIKSTATGKPFDTISLVARCNCNGQKSFRTKEYSFRSSNLIRIPATDFNDCDSFYVFSKYHEVQAFLWSRSSDLMISLNNKLPIITVKIWNYTDITNDALVTEVMAANDYLTKNRFGVRIYKSSIQTLPPDMAPFDTNSRGFNSFCGDSVIGRVRPNFDSAALNIYVTKLPNSISNTDVGGYGCNASCEQTNFPINNIIAISKYGINKTFIHELGHHLGICHISNSVNIMANANNALRENFTLGQAFKVNFSRESGLGRLGLCRNWVNYVNTTTVPDGCFAEHTSSYPCIYFGTNIGNCLPCSLTIKSFITANIAISNYLECIECNEGELKKLQEPNVVAIARSVMRSLIQNGPSLANIAAEKHRLLVKYSDIEQYVNEQNQPMSIPLKRDEYVNYHLNDHILWYYLRAITAFVTLAEKKDESFIRNRLNELNKAIKNEHHLELQAALKNAYDAFQKKFP